MITAAAEGYTYGLTLSLHDALPICRGVWDRWQDPRPCWSARCLYAARFWPARCQYTFPCGLGFQAWAAQDTFRRHPPDSPLVTGHNQSAREPRIRDRKSVVKGKSVSVRVDLVGRRRIKKKKKHNN